MFKGKKITREAIFTAIKDFDKTYTHTNQYDNWLEKDNYKFSLTYAGKLYPPKFILSQARGISTQEFSGGEQTNKVLRQLGFVVIDKAKS